MRLFVFGTPSDIGGANTELWHTLRLWRLFDLQVDIISLRPPEPHWARKLKAIGCTVYVRRSDDIDQIEGLPGSVILHFCQADFCQVAPRLRGSGCRLVWINCMTFLFPHEIEYFTQHGLPDAFVFQSAFQRSQVEPLLFELGYKESMGHLIRGAFDYSASAFQPRPHSPGAEFIVGTLARPDPDKWSRRIWDIYFSIEYDPLIARVMGWTTEIEKKCGRPPDCVQALNPAAEPADTFISTLHCLIPVSGGARENWPRIGLEAMALGVPIVVRNQDGWREMVEHGLTGFLADSDEELSWYASILACDELLRRKLARAAREHLISFSDFASLYDSWCGLFESLQT